MLAKTRRLTLLAVLAVLAVLSAAAPVGAHTGFESSSPADGDVLDGPVSEISLTFVGDASPAGDGFVVLDPSGTVREPDEVTTVDNLTWVLRFDEPLAGGVVGVRWMVAAPDTHPIEGSFAFTAGADFRPPVDDGNADNETTIDDEAIVAVPEQVPPPVADEPVDLESFLVTGDAAPTATGALASAARILNLLGAVLTIGGAAFAAFGLRGDPSDVRAVIFWVRRGGALLVMGAVMEAMSLTAIVNGEWAALTSPSDVGDALGTSAGLALALRAVGGFLAASKTGLQTTKASAIGDPVVAARQAAIVGGGHRNPPPIDRGEDEPFVYPDDRVWNPALAGLVGLILIALSFLFDGHTVSTGPRWLHALANLTHVTAASTWAGGVVMVTLTIRRRRQHGRPTRSLQLAMRFSVIATFALVAAGLAGAALSIIVVDSMSDLWSTPWGRILGAKIACVAIAAAGGAYNHRVVVPNLDRDPTHQPTIDRFRTVVTLEAVALVLVAIITAFLVSASVS